MSTPTHYRIQWLMNGTPMKSGRGVYRSMTEAHIAAMSLQDRAWADFERQPAFVMSQLGALTYEVLPVSLAM